MFPNAGEYSRLWQTELTVLQIALLQQSYHLTGMAATGMGPYITLSLR